MDAMSFQPQAAYGLQLPMGASAAPGMHGTEAGTRGPVENNAARPPSSAYVNISQEGQARLVAERGIQGAAGIGASAAVRDEPVLPRQDAAPEPVARAAGPNASLAAIVAPAPPAREEETSAASVDPDVREARRQYARQDVAESLQDRGPALAQSGLTDNREVLSA
ncbi:MAG: hypothetical protein LBO79_00660 [Zoogloeaceae bacterium]|jgi:hypothetical protein|nr:hypothetical protein [Zoogloeaceae bacterium]